MTTNLLIPILQSEIAEAGGRITLARFMELALYHPDLGYYLSEERKPGRGGDFLTSPEASPLFGITLARQVNECWERLERPDPFVIREYGSGIGGLAYDILAGLATDHTACFAATRYHLAERNRHRQADALTAFRDVGLIDHLVDESDSGQDAITGVVLANEVADAFPAHRLVRENGGWFEDWVIATTDGFAFARGEVSEGGAVAVAQIEASLTAAPDGIYDVASGATTWFGEAVARLERGYAIVIDYGYPAAELYSGHRLGGTLRAYRDHGVTDDPFADPGNTDLTAHVDFSALQRAGEAHGAVLAGITTQGAFLSSLDLGQRLVEMQNSGETSMQDYLAAQAVVLRLIDPGGLGRFRVLIMARNTPIVPPLHGLAVAPPPF